jgi:hypothetical protein
MRAVVCARLIPSLTVLALAACGPTLTKPQRLVHDAYDVCRGQGTSAKLESVSNDGRWSLIGREGEVQKVNACMGRYTRQVTQPPPATDTAAKAAPAPPAEAIRVPGTWKGMLRLAARSGETVAPSPVTLRLLKDGTALRWQLAATYNGADASAGGVALVTGDRLRLTGTYRPPGRAATSDGTRPLEVVYMGQVTGDELGVTGLTSDQQVHVLSLRRVGD